ncbi:MAG: Gfo/Idh/MocA family oxidoreductase [Ruminococcaceae bacterium]|nr:Gfo/Idh/MocA family oxidoreductase [Oscillospiraceae bacterium]
MLKVGLIGCGFMGGMHAACYEALASLGVKVTAVADVRPNFAQKLAGEGAAIYETGMELIANADVDVVDICLPTHLHTAHAVAAMRAGKHVFIEKPICIKEEEMELLLATEKQTGAKVQVGQVIRQWTEYMWLKETVDSGVYGKVLHGQFRRLSSLPTWAWEGWLHQVENSGGVAIDMHIHDVDFVRYILGNPDTVKAHAYRDDAGVIQQINALFGYGSNVSISVEAGWNYPADFPFTADFRVKFEKATAVLANGVLTVYPNEGGAITPELAEEFAGDNDIGGNVSSLGGYYNELKYFVEGLQGKNDLSVATMAEAIQSVKLVKKEVEAAGGLIAK